MLDRVLPAGVAASPALSTEPIAPRAVGSVASTEASSKDFGSMLGDMIANTATSLKTAETTSIAGVRGQASVAQVVEAVMAAEETLQGAIAIRDKAISAYLEISRMQI
jgi:flagellar hook-basal body complex protein FliE